MRPEAITSLQNPLCKRLRRAASGRDKTAFLIEGRHLLVEALAAGWPLESVVLREDLWAEWEGRLHALVSEGKVQAATPRVVGKLTTQAASEGILAVGLRRERLLPDARPDLRFLYLDAVQDPVNTGILIRSAKAFGFAGVFAGRGTCDPFRGTALFRSAGAAFHIPIWALSCEEFIVWAKRHSLVLLAANARGEPLQRMSRPVGPFALVLGNEGRGLSPQLLEHCARRVAIPMTAGWDSLNVAAAGTVLMCHFAETDSGGV
jgi:TrmH family RNA methyltransferase